MQNPDPRITRQVVLQFLAIEKSKQVNMLHKDEVYQIAEKNNHADLLDAIQDGLYNDIVQHRDFWIIKHGIKEEWQASLDRIISANIKLSKSFEGHVLTDANGKAYEASLCPACNGKRIVGIYHPLDICPICQRDHEGNALGFVLTRITE